MPPRKISTGYLTPQSKPIKKDLKRSKSSKNVRESKSQGNNDNSFEKFIECPLNRQLVLDFLESHKKAIEQYKKEEASKENSPINKIKRQTICESPSALYRRRALERMKEDSSNNSASNSSRKVNQCLSGPLISKSSKTTLNKIMQGVIAYVEIKSNGQDTSDSAKAILKSMGAAVRDHFTKDVTHVIFRDGSFMTFQKAKVMKIHLVSVLWIECSRKLRYRQSESKYPALSKDDDDNISKVCLQMHKEYEENRINEKPNVCKKVPETESLIIRRNTMMPLGLSSLYESTSNKISISSFNDVDKNKVEIKSQVSHNSSSKHVSSKNSLVNTPKIKQPLMVKLAVNTPNKSRSTLETPKKGTESVHKLDNITDRKKAKKLIDTDSINLKVSLLNLNSKTPKKGMLETEINSPTQFNNERSAGLSATKRRQSRRLYDPNEPIIFFDDSDEERDEKRQQANMSSNRKSCVVLLPASPNNSDIGDNSELDLFNLLPKTPIINKTKNRQNVDFHNEQNNENNLLDQILKIKKEEIGININKRIKMQSPITSRRCSMRLAMK